MVLFKSGPGLRININTDLGAGAASGVARSVPIAAQVFGRHSGSCSQLVLGGPEGVTLCRNYLGRQTYTHLPTSA